MMTITATVHPDLYAVKLVAADPVGTVTWYRRYAGVDTELGTGPVQWDYSPPLNVPVEYRATDDVETDTTPPVTVTSDQPVLQISSAAYAVPVRVLSQRPNEWVGSSVWHPVLGRTDPFVTIHPMQYPSGVLRIVVASDQERRAVLQLLPTGEPVDLRSPCQDVVDSMRFLVTAARDPWMNEARQRYPAVLELDYQQVTDKVGVVPPPPDRTYQTVADDHLTYQDVLDSYPTYLGLLTGTA